MTKRFVIRRTIVDIDGVASVGYVEKMQDREGKELDDWHVLTPRIHEAMLFDDVRSNQLVQIFNSEKFKNGYSEFDKRRFKNMHLYDTVDVINSRGSITGDKFGF